MRKYYVFDFSFAQTDYFRKSGGHVVEVGHPLLDRYSSTRTRKQVSFPPMHLLIVSTLGGRDLSKGLKMLKSSGL